MKSTVICIILFSLEAAVCHSSIAEDTSFIKGNIELDQSWDRIIYLSYIPTFEDLYTMSSNMIISQAKIDSLGNFIFDTGFFPEHTNLYRIHISKKGDGPYSITIGGKDENHLFLLAGKSSEIYMTARTGNSPFDKVSFTNSSENVHFNYITRLVAVSDSIASVSEAAKRSFIEKNLNKDLITIADTSDMMMVAIYAIYKSDQESIAGFDQDFIDRFEDKWQDNRNDYYDAFYDKYHVPGQDYSHLLVISAIISALIMGFYIGKTKRSGGNNPVRKLSVQEKRVFDQLRQGATNQEISEEFNIGISTVKSHVSSILSKMNLKSRKDIIHLE